MLEQLSGYRFNYKGKEEKMLGVIAQEVEKVAPELIYEENTLDESMKHKCVRYSQLTSILIEGFKEQKQRVDKLESLVENQNKQIEELKKMLLDKKA